MMLLALAALLGGLWAGLARLGWRLPAVEIAGPAQHGGLMVAGFLGTLIALERAVALSANRPGRFSALYYLAPAASGLGALLTLLGLGRPGQWLLLLGAAAMAGLFVIVLRIQAAAHTRIMALGALALAIGNGLWLAGWPIARVAIWWAGFVILTIVGERLELARVLLLGQRPRRLFAAALAVYLTGLAISPLWADAGVRLAGAGMVALAAWLLRYDIARRTIRQRGLTRFIAACLLPGYVWLAIAGFGWIAHGAGVTAGPHYDAMLHMVFLGFAFSMIFGHAPVIIPAVLGVAVAYSPRFYAHLALLHGSLLLRMAGNVSGVHVLRQWGGLLNEVAILAFLAVTVAAARSARRAGIAQPGLRAEIRG
jgi:hypothetical protein